MMRLATFLSAILPKSACISTRRQCPKIPEIGTGRCLVLVTEDAERTMCTYLGASATFDARDLDFDKIAGSKVCYLEGYLFDAPPAKHAFFIRRQPLRVRPGAKLP